MKALSKTQINALMSSFVAECRVLFGDKLSDVLLFGSYARGDYCDDSDIDVIVILDMKNDEIRKYLDDICHITSELEFEYNICIMPVLQSKNEYETHCETYGFFKNVREQGVSKYAKQVYA